VCPFCGAPQRPASSHAGDGTVWKAIASMILGLMALLTCFDVSHLNKDTFLGLTVFTITSLVLGAASLAKQKAGKKMAITGIVSAILALLWLVNILAG
ncbi:MAG TPA: hypothetical protein VLX28_13775, partial [Thermoanaerobaculia bacterium]|nr:hypothetical protein [Thermoanaerobaculia bacterium]